MAINFPNSPSVGDTHIHNNKTWTWNGTSWNSISQEINDLTSSVTWANVPDANITQSSVTQHEAALSLLESQITDLQHYSDSALDTHLNVSSAADGQVLAWDSALDDYAWVTQLTGGSSLWTQSGSDIYYTSGNVGINTTSPSSKLDIDIPTYDALIHDSNPVPSMTVGDGCQSLSHNSISLGIQSTAGKDDGDGTFSGRHAIAIGTGAIASGAYSIAIGNEVTSSDTRSISIGDVSESSGNSSLAIGRNTTASGEFSVAMGRDITVSGGSSFGIGLDNISRDVTEYGKMVIAGGEVGIDVLDPNEKLEIDGRIKISDTSLSLTPTAGVIKYDTNDFYGYDGTTWKSLTGSSYTDSEVNSHLNTSTASDSQILSWDSALQDYEWVDTYSTSYVNANYYTKTEIDNTIVPNVISQTNSAISDLQNEIGIGSSGEWPISYSDPNDSSYSPVYIGQASTAIDNTVLSDIIALDAAIQQIGSSADLTAIKSSVGLDSAGNYVGVVNNHDVVKKDLLSFKHQYEFLALSAAATDLTDSQVSNTGTSGITSGTFPDMVDDDDQTYAEFTRSGTDVGFGVDFSTNSTMNNKVILSLRLAGVQSYPIGNFEFWAHTGGSRGWTSNPNPSSGWVLLTSGNSTSVDFNNPDQFDFANNTTVYESFLFKFKDDGVHQIAELELFDTVPLSNGLGIAYTGVLSPEFTVKGDISALKTNLDSIQDIVTELSSSIGTDSTGSYEGVLDPLNSVKADITSLDSTVTALQSSLTSGLASIQAELDLTQGSIGTDSTGAYTGVIAPINTVRADIQSLQGEIQSNDGEILAIQGNITSLQGELDLTQGSIGTDSTGAYTGVVSASNTVRGDIQSLQGEIQSNDGDITTIQGNITSLQGELDLTQGSIGTDSTGAYTGVVSASNTVRGDIQSLQGEIQSNDGDITTIQGDISSLQGELDTTQGSIGTDSAGAYTGVLNPSNNVKGDIQSLKSEIDVIKGSDSALDTFQELVAYVNSLDSAQETVIINNVASLQSELDTTQGSIGTDSTGAYTGVVSASNTVRADIQSLQGQIQSNDGDITTIQGNISSLQGELDTTQGSIGTDSTGAYTGVVSASNTVRADVLSLQGEIQSNDGDITTIQGNISTIQGNISSLQSELDTTQVSIGTDSTGAYTGVVSASNTVRADILSLQGEIQSNDGDITTIQGNISSLQGELDTTQGSIGTDSTGAYTGVVSASNTVRADISSLQGEIQSNDGDITTIQGNISSLQGELDTTQGSIGTDSTGAYTGVVSASNTVRADVLSLQGSISSNSTSITGLQNEKGAANGIATLNASSQVPSSQLGSVSNHTDIDLTGNSDGKVLTWDSANQSFLPDEPFSERIAVDTSSITVLDHNSGYSVVSSPNKQLANNDLHVGFVTGFKTYSLLKMNLNHSGLWITLYTDQTSMAADISRSYTVDPDPGSGVIAEFRSNSSNQDLIMTPTTIGFNMDASVNDRIYIKIVNTSGSTLSSDYVATMTILQMEK